MHVEDVLLMFLNFSNLTLTLGNSRFDFEQFYQYSTRRELLYTVYTHLRTNNQFALYNVK